MTTPRSTPLLLAVLLVWLWTSSRVTAQCQPQWLQGEPTSNFGGSISDSATWDPDGAGPAAPVLVVAGRITAGEVWDGPVAAWNGMQWLRLGTPPGDTGRSLVTWNGNLVVAFSLPTGGARVASWNGASWQTLGTFGGSSSGASFVIVAVHQGDLYISTNCSQVDGVPIPSVARWTGSAWVGVGNGPPTQPGGLISFQNMLYAGCRGSTWPDGQLAVWNGAAWTVVATCNGSIGAMAVRNGVSITNTFLYVSGGFSQWNGVNGAVAGPIVRFSPSMNAWTGLGFTANTFVRDLAVRATGLTGTEVVAVESNGLWQQSGTSWVQLGAPVDNSTTTTYHNAAWHLMTSSGGSPTGQRLQAGAWVPLLPQGGSTGLGSVRAARAAGDDWVVGGYVGGVRQGQPGSWSTVGGLSGSVEEMARMANGDLVVTGFLSAPGLPGQVSFARWNGVAWSSLAASCNGQVHALLPLPNGDLIAAGQFTAIDGQSLAHIARWSGGSWHTLGGGFDNTVRALARLPNGDIVAGGDFTLAGSVINTAMYVARWDGTAWTAMSAPAPVLSLAAAAGGTVVTASNGVRRWSGSSWQLVYPTGTGVITLPDGDLLVSGVFFGGDGLVRLAPNGTLRQTYLSSGGVTDLVLAEDGDILVAGSIRGVDGVASFGVARLDAPCPATSQLAGPGCVGSAGALTLEANALPWRGATFRATAAGLPTTALGVVVTGFAPTSLALLAVFPTAAPGCTLHVQPDLLEVALSQGGVVPVQLDIPNSAALVGTAVRHQVVSLELDASLAFTAVAATNALVSTVGTN